VSVWTDEAVLVVNLDKLRTSWRRQPTD